MSTITVISSYKLGVSELKSVESIALAKLGVKGTLTNTIDKAVLAGVKIIAGGRELDLTLSGSINRLATALA